MEGENTPFKKCKMDSTALKELQEQIERQKQIVLGGLPVERQKWFAELEGYMWKYMEKYAEKAFCDRFRLGGEFVVQMVNKNKSWSFFLF